jgi:hypothetical protein
LLIFGYEFKFFFSLPLEITVKKKKKGKERKADADELMENNSLKKKPGGFPLIRNLIWKVTLIW